MQVLKNKGLFLAIFFATFSLFYYFYSNDSHRYSNKKFFESENDIQPLKAGDTIPQIVLKGIDNCDFNLNEALKLKPAVLIFFRGGWCPYCVQHLVQLRKIEADLVNLGYQIIAISPDSPAKSFKHAEKKGYTYLLLSDSKLKAARAFGIAFRVEDEAYKRYKAMGMDIEEASSETHHLLPVPSVFILDRNGEIRYAYSNPNYTVRVKPHTLLKAAADHNPSR